MPLPNFQDKYGETSLLNGKEFWKYKKKIGNLPIIDPPNGVIITFQPNLMNYIIKNYNVKKIDKVFNEFYILEEEKIKIGICGNFGIGAPVTGILLEELAAFGIRHFISVGVAGALQNDLKLRSIILCDGAIRDEG
ncbi:MAG: phosphorylase family protein, partial [Promethearchaeota archaeon]